jgi:GT2 family glycosyltransferase/glycosyltransferase involved in cell wall biosynthesis
LANTQLQALLTSENRLLLPDQPTPEVSIILVLYNQPHLTLACLRSIQACSSEATLELVIVDNASDLETKQLLNRCEGARVLFNDDNLGFLRACNQAAAIARGKNLLFLNNDATLLPGSIQAALDTLHSAADVGAVGAKILLLDGSLQESGSIVWSDGSCAGYGRGDPPNAPQHMFRRNVDFCSGAFLLTARDRFLEGGGFDEAYAPAYYEEVDYCMRLAQQGLRTVYEPRCAILHYEFASSAKASEAISFQIENRRVFVERWHATLTNQLAPGADSMLLARSSDHAATRVLFIDDRVPHPGLGQGFPRANSMVRVLNDMGAKLTFYPIDPIEETWPLIYADLPRTVEVMIGHGREGLDQFFAQRAGYYDLIIVSRPHNAGFVREALAKLPDAVRGALIAYDAEALFAIREILKKQVLNASQMRPDEQTDLIRRELQIADFANVVLAVSEAERQHFLDGGIHDVRVLGHMLEPDLEPARTPFVERKNLLFVGAITSDDAPNTDAILWFVEHVWPILRSRLGAEVQLQIAGILGSARISALAQEGVELLGFVDDLRPLYAKTRVFIAPHRYAGGIPYKVHEAAQHGLPALVSSLIATQLGWENNGAAIVAATNNAADCANACAELYQNQRLWEQTQQAMLLQIRKDCSPTLFTDTLAKLLAAARDKSTAYRATQGTITSSVRASSGRQDRSRGIHSAK